MVQSLLLFNGTPSSESVMDWNCTDSTDAANASIDCEPPPQLTQYAIVKGSILSALAVASILANSYTLLSIALGKKSSSSLMYTLLFQLVITDLLVSIWCLSGEAVWTFVVEWKAGDTFCRIFKFFQVHIMWLSCSILSWQCYNVSWFCFICEIVNKTKTTGVQSVPINIPDCSDRFRSTQCNKPSYATGVGDKTIVSKVNYHSLDNERHSSFSTGTNL